MSRKQTITVQLPEGHVGLVPGGWNPGMVSILAVEQPVEVTERWKYTVTIWVDSPGPGQLSATTDMVQQKLVTWLHGHDAPTPFTDPYNRKISVQVSKVKDT